jgi:hypothetical protein
MTFNIIHHRGEPNTAEFEGVKISRQKALFIREWGRFIPCMPYDDHFIFEVPPMAKIMGMSEYMCTCGSAAVVATPETERGRMFVCLFHATYGAHQTSVVNKGDFEKATNLIIEPRARKWPI